MRNRKATWKGKRRKHSRNHKRVENRDQNKHWGSRVCAFCTACQENLQESSDEHRSLARFPFSPITDSTQPLCCDKMTSYLFPGPPSFPQVTLSRFGQQPIVVMVAHLNVFIIFVATVDAAEMRMDTHGLRVEDLNYWII